MIRPPPRSPLFPSPTLSRSQQLDRQRVGAPLQRARELEQERGARRAIAGPDEREVARPLRVVVPADDQTAALLRPAWQRGADVHHVNRTDGSLRVEGLLDRLEAG